MQGYDEHPAPWRRQEDRPDTATLARQCAEETRRFLARLPSAEDHCLELFRRALVERDDVAWAALHTCYSGMVTAWARRAVEEVDAVEPLVALAFERLWMAVDADKFARFPNLRSLLQYLKMCVRAAALDRARAASRHAADVRLDSLLQEGGGEVLPAADDVEAQTLDSVGRHEFWQLIQRHLQDTQEAQLVRLSFVEGMSPREICRREPARFPTAADVYRTKRNILDRLRRSPELQQLAGRRHAGEIGTDG